MKKSSFIYSDKFQQYDYGGGHPLKMVRLRLTYELLKAYGVFGREGVSLVEAEPCTRGEAEGVHGPEYLDVLKGIDAGKSPKNPAKFGLGHGDNPVFKGVYAGSMLSTGASMQAARIVHSGAAEAAFNISGGLHHAMPNRASGFCYINDPAVAIKHLVAEGRKVAYVDIDAHHGDGVQSVFFDTDSVLTVSLHEDPHYLFPGTGLPYEIGAGKGRGYSFNLPLAPGTSDEVFTWAFFELVPMLMDKFRPDVIVTQLGCDTFYNDPLAHLQLTTDGFARMVEGFRDMKLPWVALGGGGYNIVTVARAWSLAFGIMAGVELPDELPESFRELLKGSRVEDMEKLRDKPVGQLAEDLKKQRGHAEDMLLRLKREAFPALGIRP